MLQNLRRTEAPEYAFAQIPEPRTENPADPGS